MFKPMALAACVGAALLQGVQAVVAESTRAGAFTIQYNAFTADTLTPEIARANAIQRSKGLGVLNVSVIKDRPGAAGTSVKALVDVDLVNDKSPKGPVAMHEVEASGAVSYLGQFPIADGQELDFEIRVRPAGAAETTTLRLRQEFFTESP
ncbi:DUF4426 domain-containing protein [Candidatus Thiodictyon syntrophicum]|jgi:hypothetical protein|uniref:DUF4426 domain-containing protein n=1 Tax=Candidatus Thiodictyon syntrophicum TaxID=1166950 RepID=A0A2K8UBZ2_9GAMM|nr:DUF4426 domain-containing protein [Candidatus Thiodictyon syntrophicum]AUB83104.1 hypothetical protein THSYN_20585 [Candidatus Thiodictyon syntrophicum]